MYGVSSSKRVVVVFAFLIHLIFVYSAFDVFFQSPVVPGVERATSTIEGPVKRLVIFVADGARADAVFGGSRAQHVRERARSGAWGVSHARAPTESRPGHVALLGGFYEDPSAITKGWSANPVEFDHLLNQSDNAWAWGAPSVVPLFGDGIKHVRQFFYDEALEDFASANDHEALDEWVFERVIDHLKRANASENEALDGERNVFLLHLLGLDSSGHAHKPHSKEYFENVRKVDEGVRRVEEAFAERFRDDGRTAFIFTADHGMSNKGAHGDGDPGCTETPLVVWGAGIASGRKPTLGACRGAPKTPIDWEMDPTTRCDVDQADIAPLGAALLGLPPPRHNFGLLPGAYLSEHPANLRSAATIANAEQLLALHELKSKRTKKRALRALFSFQLHPEMQSVSARVAEYNRFALEDQHDAATRMANEVARACLTGLEYLHTYDRALLQIVVVACFATWMVLLGVNLLPRRNGDCEAPSGVPLTIACVYGVLTSCVLIARRTPLTYFLYFGLPAYFSLSIANTFSVVKTDIIDSDGIVRVANGIVGGICVAETICRGFHDRIVFTHAFAAATFLLVVLAIGSLIRRDFDNAARATITALSTAIIAPFTTFSIELEANTKMILYGLFASAIIASVSHFLLRRLDIFQDDDIRSGKEERGQVLFSIQLAFILLTATLISVVDGSQRAKLPF